jgi:hypothetical protein
LFELIHTTVVPVLIQKNWLFFAFEMLGFTLAELADLVTLIVHGDEAEPQVLAALHIVSGCGSSHMYLLFACASPPVRRRMQVHKRNALPVLNRR